MMSGIKSQVSESISYDLKFPEGKTNSDTPVVFLLGWSGSTARLLFKYADIYLRNGCITITFPQSNLMGFIKSNLANVQIVRAQKLANILVENQLTENPVLLHTLSKGGTYQFHYLAKELTVQKRTIIGAVFDSSPGINGLYRGIITVYRVFEVKSSLPKFLLFSFASFSMFCFFAISSFSNFFGSSQLVQQDEVYLSATKYGWPHLYLYSDADDQISKTGVEFAMQQRGKINTKVWGHNFITSPHVQHFRMFPQLYVKKCEEFLDFCLGNFKKQSEQYEILSSKL